ncbi:hypothetical protein R7042_29720, partial [Vibrio sp. 1262-1]|nr:hypothetical protein [Vibrio sp. 1262-1]
SLNDVLNAFNEPVRRRIAILADDIPKGRIRRFHSDEDALITLPNDEVIAITNQWSISNITRLILFAEQSGMVVEKAD